MLLIQQKTKLKIFIKTKV